VLSKSDQGISGALREEFIDGGCSEPLSVTFADYLLPTAREVPGVEVIVSEDAPSPLNPLGVKGAGEGGITPVGAAIASAIDDALQKSGSVTQLPVTPQRLKALMAAGQGRRQPPPAGKSGRYPFCAASMRPANGAPT